MLPEAVRKKINFEVSQISTLLQTYNELLAQASSGGIDLVQTAATAHVLHSFYNGVENIIQLVLKHSDIAVPESKNSHQLVLEAAENQSGLLRPSTKAALVDFLGFRHVVRHRYSMELDEKRMRALCSNINSVWASVSEDVQSFLNRS